MSNGEPSAVTRWRNRQGFARVELQVRKGNVALVRDVAKALVDPEREIETRTWLREKFVTRAEGGLKALLFSAPLEGIDLKRPRDLGREIDL